MHIWIFKENIPIPGPWKTHFFRRLKCHILRDVRWDWKHVTERKWMSRYPSSRYQSDKDLCNRNNRDIVISNRNLFIDSNQNRHVSNNIGLTNMYRAAVYRRSDKGKGSYGIKMSLEDPKVDGHWDQYDIYARGNERGHTQEEKSVF